MNEPKAYGDTKTNQCNLWGIDNEAICADVAELRDIAFQLKYGTKWYRFSKRKKLQDRQAFIITQLFAYGVKYRK